MSLAHIQPTAAGSAAPFWRDVDALGERTVETWSACRCDTPLLGAPVLRRHQRRNARATERLIGELGERIETWPEERDARQRWRRDTRALVQGWGERHFGWPSAYRDLPLDDGFVASSSEFARRARDLDASLENDEVFQALRNVWIANSIQMLLDLEVGCTPSIFAYSMLYPLTDNLLDDPDVPAAEKRRLNDGLTRRLEGRAVLARTRREAAIYDLVGTIEAQYSRPEHPGVYLSLRAIHRAQVRSLEQRRSLPDRDLLAISVAKGGASVLADGYLAAGVPTSRECEFFFDFGVMLQLLDDLQDVEEDLRVGHETLFSRAAREGPLDQPASRLAHFIDRVLTSTTRFSGDEHHQHLDLIRRNCIALLVGAVADNPKRFTAGFSGALERRWPLRFAAMRRLRVRAQQEARHRRRALERAGRTGTLLERLAEL